MKVIGITGGIGAGKSTVAKFIMQEGYPVYSSDQRAKQLMHESTKIREFLIATYGKEIYIHHELNRELLSQHVFKNPKALEKLNQIVHPEVFNDFQAWKAEQKNNLVFKEAAILFESGSYQFCDFSVTVEADEEIRIQRTMQRSNLTREQVMNRINNQWKSEQRQALADYVIFNNTDLEQLQKETHQFLVFLLNKFTSHEKTNI